MMGAHDRPAVPETQRALVVAPPCANGVTRVLQKPVEFERLLSVVREFCAA
jgi:hypothetical protein